MKALLVAAALALTASSTAAAQPPPDGVTIVSRTEVMPPRLSLRPFVMGTENALAAVHTFEAVFGRAYQPFFGGGLQVVLDRRFFVELSASRFRKTGERAFQFNDETFRLGLPLTAEITPFEVTGGYRFERRADQRIVPYAGAGLGSYAYKETSPSSDPGENLEARHSGFVLEGGVEFRLQRWVRVAVDEQYTRVPGILGAGGISKSVSEDDLGGIALRVKVVVGR